VNKSNQDVLIALVYEYADAPHTRDCVCEFISTMEPIDVAFVHVELPMCLSESHLSYLVARTSEDMMFKTNCLLSVRGVAPYSQVYDFGLTDDAISQYRSQWINAGIDPLLPTLSFVE